ncbi:hypothetical protein BDZ45DRAFT_744975 [Acephala macrosclerotiorum]|nr:hypothetical protein BDZ45DRAFT_744975 [Acephala macrosclerotiorum]
MPAVPQLLPLIAPSSDYNAPKRFTTPTHDSPKAAIALTFESRKILQYAPMWVALTALAWAASIAIYLFPRLDHRTGGACVRQCDLRPVGEGTDPALAGFFSSAGLVLGEKRVSRNLRKGRVVNHRADLVGPWKATYLESR